MGDDEFLKELAKDGWAERLNPADIKWVPQGTLFIASGQRLQMPDRKETND